MTNREISDILGISIRTIRRTAKKLYPSRFGPKHTAKWTEQETIRIIDELRKKGFVSVDKAQDGQRGSDDGQNGRDAILDMEAGRKEEAGC